MSYVYIVAIDSKPNTDGYKTLAQAQQFIADRLNTTVASLLKDNQPYLNVTHKTSGIRYTIYDIQIR